MKGVDSQVYILCMLVFVKRYLTVESKGCRYIQNKMFCIARNHQAESPPQHTTHINNPCTRNSSF